MTLQIFQTVDQLGNLLVTVHVPPTVQGAEYPVLAVLYVHVLVCTNVAHEESHGRETLEQ